MVWSDVKYSSAITAQMTLSAATEHSSRSSTWPALNTYNMHPPRDMRSAPAWHRCSTAHARQPHSCRTRPARAPRCCPAPSHLRGPSSGTAGTHHAGAPTPCALNTPCAPPRRTQALGARHHRTPREPCAAAAPLPAACWCKPHRLCRVRALCALPAACWFCRCRRRCCRWQRPGVPRQRPGTPPWMWSTCSCEPFCGARAFMVGLQLQPDRNRIVQPADSHKSTPLRKSPLVFSRRTGGFLGNFANILAAYLQKGPLDLCS